MSDEKIKNVGGIVVDMETVNKLTYWLIIKERNNIRTKERSEGQMLTDIKNKIEEVAR